MDLGISNNGQRNMTNCVFLGGRGGGRGVGARGVAARAEILKCECLVLHALPPETGAADLKDVAVNPKV